MSENSLKNLEKGKNYFERDKSLWFRKLGGMKGGSRKTLAKKCSAILASISQRKCIICPYLDVCYVGLSALSSPHIQKAWQEGDKTLANQIKCKLPGWNLKYLALIEASPDFNNLEKMNFARMSLEANDFHKTKEIARLMHPSMWKNKINFQLTKEQKDIEIRMVIVDPKPDNKSGDTGDKSERSRSNTIDADTSKE